MAANPPTLTTDQLDLYLQRIKYADDTTSRVKHLKQSVEKSPLEALTELQRRHLSSIPWGNSALHYSNHHSISLERACIFEKLVVRRLDGYCMENTNLFYMVLSSLGYQVYPAGGRVSRAGVTGNPSEEGYVCFIRLTWLSRSHMIVIVTIAGQKYLVDVGYGRNNPTSPLPLQENVPTTSIPPEEVSLIKAPLSEFVDQTQKVWIYQARSSSESKWIPQYSFTETEFLLEDFAMMSYFTSTNPEMPFTQKLAFRRMIVDEQTLEVIGIYILAGTEVKRVLRGETEVIKRFTTEEDRVHALAEYFDMHFERHEIEGIRGLPSQIK
ncbi:hypothetical protein ASPVEDRAFT_120215 [Aspergillus versicolor CBS 583.65]|uniref:Uncharacterized protein n=1 Tax=Aspergillus versicolor CBS 583.65 TaxID=1036611 RepID=A0A1L9P2W4_ASPVE|nr:uncharacterized protein ASPVEDRAFT_120215 [Aspergillus versicolor CBS 583.65]OJI95846.1 hypothetical protein ASPVEDRAFT_120215 [Aspergillus versicolor CBS 583.65]